MSSSTGICERSNKRPLYIEDSNILPTKPEKHQKKIEKKDTSDTPLGKQLMLGNAASINSTFVKPKGCHIDMAWEWNSLKDINNKNMVTCDFCLKTTTGGITRAKKHQMGLKGDVSSCKKIPPEIKLKIKEAYEKRQMSRKNACAKKVRVSIAKFFRENGIPFNVARSTSFKTMIEAVAEYGKGLNPPCYPELKVGLLKKELGQTKTKCSIESDAIVVGEPSELNTPDTRLTITAPIEVEKEEKHEENLANQLTKPQVTKVYVRRKNMVRRLDDAADQV